MSNRPDGEIVGHSIYDQLPHEERNNFSELKVHAEKPYYIDDSTKGIYRDSIKSSKKTRLC